MDFSFLSALTDNSKSVWLFSEILQKLSCEAQCLYKAGMLLRYIDCYLSILRKQNKQNQNINKGYFLLKLRKMAFKILE